jgi:hypothetical protein
VVIDDIRHRLAPRPGSYIVVMAFGPGPTLYSLFLPHCVTVDA